MCDLLGRWRYRTISKTVTVNVTITSTVLKEYSINFLITHSLIDFTLVVLQSLMFKAYENFVTTKIELFHFFLDERFTNLFFSFLDWGISRIDEYNHGFFSKFRTVFSISRNWQGRSCPSIFPATVVPLSSIAHTIKLLPLGNLIHK